MKVELHIVQNFAPSNLNRDDTGSPKDCELGGVRRARISSQCYKRAIRQDFEAQGTLPKEELATRTKRLIETVGERVERAANVPLERAKRAVTTAIEGAGLKTNPKNDKTEYLWFLPARSLDRLAEVVANNLDKLAGEDAGLAKEEPAAADAKAKAAKISKKKEKADAKDAADPAIRKAVEEILADGSRTPELALFGRMIADKPDWNVEAACQVAHAISTHRVSMEFDFYTAIDDLKRDDTAGSDMMGTIPFNSACFYRYLVVDTDDLVRNLGGDAAAQEQAKRTVSAFVRAASLAVPTGKQNSMAAHNPPSLVLAEVTSAAAPRSLANAFVKPVRPTHESDLVTQSVLRLGDYATSLDKVYGGGGRKRCYVVVDPNDALSEKLGAALGGIAESSSLDDFVATVVNEAFAGQA